MAALGRRAPSHLHLLAAGGNKRRALSRWAAGETCRPTMGEGNPQRQNRETRCPLSRSRQRGGSSDQRRFHNSSEKLLCSHFLSLGASHRIAALNLCLVSSAPLNSRIITCFSFSLLCGPLTRLLLLHYIFPAPPSAPTFFPSNLPLTFSARRLHTQTARTL